MRHGYLSPLNRDRVTSHVAGRVELLLVDTLRTQTAVP